MLNPGKTNPAQAPAAPGENRNLGCHRVPTNPQHHPLCREQGWSSRRNSIVHKGKGKILPGHPFPAGRDGGSHPAPPPQHRGQIQRLFTGSLLIPKRLPGCPGSSCSSPHARSSSFQAAAKGAASPAAATMQRLTGPAVKGNVGASARNIKISDKGAIVARESLNFTWIRVPLSDKPTWSHAASLGAGEKRQRTSPGTALGTSRSQFSVGGGLGMICFGAAGSKGEPHGHGNQGEPRGKPELNCQNHPGQRSGSSRKQDTGSARPFHSSSEPRVLVLPGWAEDAAETALPILFRDSPAAHCAATALSFGGEAPQEPSLLVLQSPCRRWEELGAFPGTAAP